MFGRGRALPIPNSGKAASKKYSSFRKIGILPRKWGGGISTLSTDYYSFVDTGHI